MTIKGLIDACQPGLGVYSTVLDPCNCSMYYDISGFETKLSCKKGQLFDHTLNKCRSAAEVKRHHICKPEDPLKRCDISSQYFLKIATFCQGHLKASDFPVRTENGVTQTFISLSQSTGTDARSSQTSNIPHHRAETVNIAIFLVAMLTGAVLMLMLFLLVRIFRRIKERSSRPNCSSNSSDEASNVNAVVIYDDIEDGGEACYECRQRSNSSESTLTMSTTRYEMPSNDSFGNLYCYPGELIKNKGAVGKTVPEGTLNYITPAREMNDRSQSNYQSEKCNAKREYSYADDTKSFENIRTEATYSYADPLED
ncbi:hypothetical protein ACJMK2_016070 [Sinanodonta woodiana]|uniref:Chitin-binding type-2 domain-containing protein n=1 Tax=Sinanodonta woodiana TaxID=1069815 RepID=A0ABD3UTT5_SINWO